jgi:REP element-mobilizing transposase RayT
LLCIKEQPNAHRLAPETVFSGRGSRGTGYFCATVGQMTEEMIKQYLEHHFEPTPNDDFKMEPE